MTEAMDRILRLVSEGRLTADEAGPILDALDAASAKAASAKASGARAKASGGSSGSRGPSAGIGVGSLGGSSDLAGDRRPLRAARVEVFEGGKRVVNLRIPISLGRFALTRVPGLSAERIEEVEAAIAGGQSGPILDVEDDDGGGVRIVLE